MGPFVLVDAAGSAVPEGGSEVHMPKIFAVILAGGMLLAGAVAASAKLDTRAAAPAIHVQTQDNGGSNQTGNHGQTGSVKGVQSDTPAVTPATTAPKTPTTVPKTATTGQTGANDQCGFDGEFNGEQQDTGACNTQDGQSGAKDQGAANDTTQGNANQEG